MEFILPSLRVASITNLMEEDANQRCLHGLIELGEDKFIVGFHHRV